MIEVARKLESLRELMRAEGANSIRLKGVDWFAWATGGGDSTVIFTNEIGVAEVLVTERQAFVISDAIERERLAVEEVPPEFEIVSLPWASETGLQEFLRAKAGRTLSDRPSPGEEALPRDAKFLKWQLLESEIHRYRLLGRDAAEAVTEALQHARPEMQEQELAGLAAAALWKRGIHPTLTMVGGEGRVSSYRHPIAKSAPLGQHAMLVVCGRRHGLYANLTRHVFFRPLIDEEMNRNDNVAFVESVAFQASSERLSLPDIYLSLESAYREVGDQREIEKHHQGGPTGYLSREAVAKPWGDRRRLPTGNLAFAWNPSLPGAKIEDTVLLNENGQLEILTVDPRWPTFSYAGRERPAVWVRA